MEGGRERFQCPFCARGFNYWVQTTAPHPKIKCYYCGKESFPKGAPPAAAPVPAAPPAPPPPAEEPVVVN